MILLLKGHKHFSLNWRRAHEEGAHLGLLPVLVDEGTKLGTFLRHDHSGEALSPLVPRLSFTTEKDSLAPSHDVAVLTKRL